MPGPPARQPVLDLPEGPRQLFAAVEPVLSEFFTPAGYRIGGETVLAGLWSHRHSTDVDLFVEPSFYQGIVRDRGAEIERTLAGRVPGMDPERSWVEPEHLDLAVGASEVTMLPAVPIHPAPAAPHRVRNSEVAAESVEEILSKKVRLRMIGEGAYLIRDLYDLACAEAVDPQALGRALAAEPPRRLRQIARELRSLGDFQGDLLQPRFSWTHPEIRDRVARICENAAALPDPETGDGRRGGADPKSPAADR